MRLVPGTPPANETVAAGAQSWARAAHEHVIPRLPHHPHIGAAPLQARVPDL
jgi:hypothetical protein